jgi:hypothetical protein
MHFFPSRNITIYMAKLFIIRSFAVLMMLQFANAIVGYIEERNAGDAIQVRAKRSVVFSGTLAPLPTLWSFMPVSNRRSRTSSRPSAMCAVTGAGRTCPPRTSSREISLRCDSVGFPVRRLFLLDVLSGSAPAMVAADQTRRHRPGRRYPSCGPVAAGATV